MCDVPVEYCQCEIACWNQRKDRSQDEELPIDSVPIHRVKQGREQQQGQHCERAEIGSGCMSQQKTAQSFRRSGLITETRLESS